MRTFTGGLLALVLLLAGCGSPGPRVGGVQESDGWIYYASNDDGGFYRMRTDLTGTTPISGGLGGDWQVHGDTIYWVDDGGISRLGTDGSDPKRLAAVSEPLFDYATAGDWIVYATKPGTLHRIRTNGTEDSVIADLPSFGGDLQVAGDTILYRDGADLYRMSIDGTGAAQLAEGAGLYAAEGDWVYFGTQSDKGGLDGISRIRLDGTERARLTDGAFVAIDGPWLYFSQDGALHRSALDGTGVEKLNDVDLWTVFDVAGDHLYFGEYSGAAYRINLDGSNRTRIG